MALKLLFAGTTAAQGAELWMLDVATGQSSMVMDVRPGTAGGFYNVAITDLGNGTALFGARASGSSSPELWVTNGADWGTRPLLDATAPSQAVFPRDVMMTSSGDVLFVAKTGAIQDLWVTDGTSAHTSKLGLNTNGLSSSFWDFTGLADGRVLFTSDVGNDASTRDQWNIWISDGTRAGTVEAGGNAAGNYNTFAALGDGRVIFAGYSDKGIEPWISDGTPTGTSLLKDVAQGYRWSSPAIPFSLADGRVMFVVQGNGAGADVNELWVTNGTAGNTSLFVDLAAAPSRLRYVPTYTSYTPAYGFMPLANNKVVFVGDDYDRRYTVAYYPNRGNGRELWSLDLTTKAVTQLTNTPGQASSLWDRNTNLDRTYRLDAGHMLFIGKDASHGQELWITDGTVAGTHIVKDIAPGTATGGARSFLRLPDGRLVFTAPDPTLGNTGIWTTDGTETGTSLLFSVAGTTAIGTLALADLNPVLPDTTTSVGDPDLLTDTGISASDNLTAVPAPVFSGIAEAGATVTLLEGTVELGSAVASAGSWTVTAAALTAGLHTVSAQARDAAGNTATSATLSVTIDLAVELGDPDLQSDTGLSVIDNVTAAVPASFAGTAEAGSTVTLYEGTASLGSAVASDGSWTVIAAALADGPHLLRAAVLDAAGNTSTSAALPVTIDTATAVGLPDLQSDTGLSGTDDLTAAGQAVFAGTAENGATVVLLDGTAPVGSAVAAAGNWTVTAALADGLHRLHATALDAAGNTADTAELAVTVDTATTAGLPDLLTDSGLSTSDGLTAVTAAVLAGTAEAGTTVALYEGSVALGSAIATGGNWTITATPLADGLHWLHAVAQDGAGNTAAGGELAITIDSATAIGLPSLDPVGDSFPAGDDRTSYVAPLVHGTAEAFSTVQLLEAGASLGQAVADAVGAWSISLPALALGAHSLVAEARDAAGNTASAPWLLTIDPIPAPQLLGLAEISDTGIAGDGMTRQRMPVLRGSGRPGDTVLLYEGNALRGMAEADDGGEWRIASFSMTGGAGTLHTLTAQVLQSDGAVSVRSAPVVITIDDLAPAAPGNLALAPASDTAPLGDGLTADNTPTITGTADPGTTIVLLQDADQGLGSVLVGSSGIWSLTLPPRVDGGVSLSARAVDAAGNSSAAAGLLVTIDATTTAPVAQLAAASDSGVAGDGITRVTTPQLTGTAEAGATVVLTEGSLQLGSTVAGNDAHWLMAVQLGEGGHGLVLTAQDAAGNTAGAALLLTIDTTPPDAPEGLVLDAAYDSGLPDDRLTNQMRPVIAGAAEPGSTVLLREGTTMLGSGVTSAGGEWRVQGGPLGEGVHALSALAVDVAGNSSTVSVALAITVDTTPPPAPTDMVLAAGSDSGVQGDGITSDLTPSFDGRAEAGLTILLFEGAELRGLGLAGPDGRWSVTSTEFSAADGEVHGFTARAMDVAGNVSPGSGTVAVTLVPVEPLPVAVPSAPVLAPDSDTGVKGDGITADATPMITGTAVAGTVQVFDGGTLLGSGVVDGGGQWAVVPNAPLPDGPHALTAQVVDPTGGTSAFGPPLLLTVDTAPPAAGPAPILHPDSDTGPKGDGITADDTPTVTGVVAPGLTVVLQDGGTVLGSTVAGSLGAWSITSPALSSGPHAVTTQLLDAAGNASGSSPALDLLIDLSTPAPSGLALDAASNSGLSDDLRTNDITPTIIGTAEAGATVRLYEGNQLLGSGVAGGDGAWAITTPVLSAGSGYALHPLVAVAEDVAGNTAASQALPVTIDVVLPVAWDVDGDRRAELVRQDDGLGEVYVWWVNGLSAPQARSLQVLGTTARLLGSGDINGDDIADLLLRDEASGALVGWTMQPDGRSGEEAYGATPAGWTLRGIADIDHNDLADLVFQDGNGDIHAMLLRGHGSVQQRLLASPGAQWLVKGVADLDGNGSADILLQDQTNGYLWVYFMGPGGIIDQGGLGGPRPEWTLLDLGDVDADGRADLLWRNTRTAELYFWKMQGKTLVDQIGFKGVPEMCTVQRVQDMTGDGKADLVFANPDGTASAWLMNGLSVTQDGPVMGVDRKALSFGPPPPVLALAAGSDSWIAGDNITTDTTPTLGGSAIAGQVVMLHDGARLLGSVAAAADGSWSITAPELGGGNAVVHSLWAVACDGAGAMSVTSTRLLTLDTVVPDAPAGLALAGQQDGQRYLRRDSGAVTTDRTPVLQGTAEAGMTVTLFEGGRGLGSALVDDLGHWRVASRDLGGEVGAVHRIDAVVTDAVGHASPASAVLTITMGTVLPVPGDLDGNGGADLLLWHGGSGALRAWMMDGASLTDALDLGPAAGAPLPVLRGQVDFGVGAALVLHQGNDPLTGWSIASLDRAAGSIMLPPAGSLAGVGTDWPAAGSLVAQGMADLDGDDMPELIMRQGGTGALSSWRIGADGSLGGPQDLGNPGAQWQVLGVGEFDGDGLGDLLFEGPGGYLWIWRMQGAAVQHQGGLEGPGPGWALAAIGDSNGDARSDLLWRNGADGRLLLWDMDAGGRIAAHDRGVLVDAAVIRLRDLDHDGSADLIWQDSGGAIHLSLSPDQPLSTATVLQVGPGWTLI